MGPILHLGDRIKVENVKHAKLDIYTFSVVAVRDHVRDEPFLVNLCHPWLYFIHPADHFIQSNKKILLLFLLVSKIILNFALSNADDASQNVSDEVG